MNKVLLSLSFAAAFLAMAAIAPAQAAGLSGGAATQTQPGAASGLKQKVNRQQIIMDVLAKLNLTVEQKTKLKDLRDKNQDAIKDLQKQIKAKTITKADAIKKRQEMNKTAMANLQAILTPAQAKQFKTLMKEEVKKAQSAASGGGKASGQ